MTIPDEVERSAMTEPTNAQLAADLRREAAHFKYFRPGLSDYLEFAAQRLEAMDEFMNFAEAALEHIDNPLIAMHLSAALEAAFGGER